MNWLTVGAGALLGAVMVLTFVDRAGGDVGRRAFLALAWPAFGAVGLWRARFVDMTWDEIWVGCLIAYGGVLLVTGLRPVLVMTEALPGRTRANERLMRRAHFSQALVLLVILAGVGSMEFGQPN